MPVEPLHALRYHVEPDHQFQVKNIFVQGLHQTEQILQVCGQAEVHSSLYHIGAHVPVEHEHGAAGVVFRYQTLFFSFVIYWSFNTRKGLAELVQSQDGHVDFSILFYKWRRGTFLTMFMKMYWPKLQYGRFSIL